MPLIPLQQLYDDPRNANVCAIETLDKIRRNIERTGLYPPLIVRPDPKKKDRYIIVDGHHRKRILEELGRKEAECQVWDVDDREAQLALATLNRLRGEDEPRKRAKLLQSLSKTFAMPDLVKLVPESKGEIEDLMALLEMDWEETKAQVQKQMEEEAVLLPIPFTCMIAPKDFPQVEQALSRFQGSDQGARLVALCQHVLNQE